MMRARPRPILLAVVLGIFAAALVARSEPGAPLRDRPGVVSLAARLEALDPSRPMGYFELAEEIAYEKTSDADADLARRLFVLAYELDRAAGSAGSLGPSVCLALRDLSVDSQEKSWLSAMAGHAGAPAAASGELREPDSEAPRQPFAEAILLATIHFAAQEPRGAQELLRRADVATSIAPLRERHPILARIGAEIASATVCPECRNRRVASSSIDSAVPARPCPTCGGNPGPRLSELDYVSLLRLQAELAGVEPESWSADLLLNGASPIRDADPGALASYFGVDPLLAKWRRTANGAGEWYRPDQP